LFSLIAGVQVQEVPLPVQPITKQPYCST